MPEPFSEIPGRRGDGVLDLLPKLPVFGAGAGPPNKCSKNDPPPPKKLVPPKVPGGILTGADDEPFGRSMAMSAILRSEPLRMASRRWSRP